MRYRQLLHSQDGLTLCISLNMGDIDIQKAANQLYGDSCHRTIDSLPFKCEMGYIDIKRQRINCTVTDVSRLNNNSRSRELRTFLYDVDDLLLETVTKFFSTNNV